MVRRGRLNAIRMSTFNPDTAAQGQAGWGRRARSSAGLRVHDENDVRV